MTSTVHCGEGRVFCGQLLFIHHPRLCELVRKQEVQGFMEGLMECKVFDKESAFQEGSQ